MEEWRRMYPEDVEIEQAFWCEKKPGRKRARTNKRWTFFVVNIICT
jgi:hypothetical protein